jgi:hypothetical protein
MDPRIRHGGSRQAHSNDPLRKFKSSRKPSAPSKPRLCKELDLDHVPSQEGISCKSRRLRSNAIGISWYRVILQTRSMHPEPYSRRYAGMPRLCRGSRQRQTAHKFFRLVVVALDSHCAVVATVQRMHVQRESMPRMPSGTLRSGGAVARFATIDIVYEDGRGHQQNEARSRCGLTHRAGSDRSGA